MINLLTKKPCFLVNNFDLFAFDFDYIFLPFTLTAKDWHFFCLFLSNKSMARKKKIRRKIEKIGVYGR